MARGHGQLKAEALMTFSEATTIRISKETHTNLYEIGRTMFTMKDTLNDVLYKVLKYYIESEMYTKE